MINIRIAVASLVCLAAAGATLAADPPEAKDRNVARCADAAARRLAGGGFDNARAAAVMPRRADACILRWEEKFSPSNPKKVATLIIVPVNVELLNAASKRNATLHARCGFTDNKLLAIEIVESDKAC